MATNKTVTYELLASEISKLLEDYVGDVNAANEKAVKAACVKAKTVAKENANFKPYFVNQISYKDSLVYTMQRGANFTTGWVGSKKYPGLVHLLNNGHVSPTGGWVNGVNHMGVGFEAGRDELMRVIREEL